MSYPEKILNALLGAALAFCLPACLSAQESAAAADAGEISATLRTVAYPEIIYPNQILPEWDRGYFLHHDIEEHFSPDTPNVTMWDANGKHVRDGRIWPPDAASLRIRRAAATREGAILATGWAILQDGSVTHFIAKTDLAGHTAQVIKTDSFGTEQLCEAGDGSVWALGQEVKDGEAQRESEVLHQYSFEKGLLHSYLPQRSVEAIVRSKVPWFTPSGSFVRCGNDKVSVYLNFTDEYVEVDTSSFELKRWKLNVSVVDNGKASGLGITGDGKVYASFSKHGMSGPTGLTGLYEVKADSNISVARLLPVAGTIIVTERGKVPPPGTIVMLWGADGTQLVLWRVDEPDGTSVSWVNVIPN